MDLAFSNRSENLIFVFPVKNRLYDSIMIVGDQLFDHFAKKVEECPLVEQDNQLLLMLVRKWSFKGAFSAKHQDIVTLR